MALLLGTTSDSCASLRQSIEANNGIIHPIVVNKQADGTYVVIEGNTRLQIYKDFRKANIFKFNSNRMRLHFSGFI
ncbi:ParB/Srx family N-terminal domain-containing protein [Ruminococcus sp. JE7B6]|uniref:ParB/Srx family N-terminal domain-containing protein n=1 Tax=Ruminococcus sp. JE7B6 TaxID=3233380 RepID=UPI00389B26D4